MILPYPAARRLLSFLPLLSLLLSCGDDSTPVAATPERPNILWLTIEDASPYVLGCYGNELVRTPNIDSLAAHGLRFTNVSAVAPYCSPARSTIISGQYATTYGTDWHREGRRVPAGRYFFPRWMRQAGYFTTNIGKTDYNVTDSLWQSVSDSVWDINGQGATYNSPERDPAQPFFAVFNNLITHMSRLTSVTTEGRSPRHISPDAVTVPPYLPDEPDVRDDLAWHFEKAEQADRWVGKFLTDLRERDLADNTIVFFYADHGGSLPRGKAFPFESGLRAPLIVYVPARWREVLPADWAPGTVVDRLIDFTDLAPTVLQLAGAQVPSYLDGQRFLGPAPLPAPKPIQHGFRTNTAHHYDPSRTAYDGRFKYIRFFTPYRHDGVRQEFQWRMPANLAWDEVHQLGGTDSLRALHFQPKPTELLFDLAADPYELRNLSDDPAYASQLDRLREATREHLHATQDLGLLPQSARHMSESVALYDYVRQTDYPVDSLIEAAYLGSAAQADDTEALLHLLQSPHPALRFWGAAGLATLTQRGQLTTLPPAAAPYLRDDNEDVRSTLALAYGYSAAPEPGYATLREMIRAESVLGIGAAEMLRERAAPLAPDLERAVGSENYLVRFSARSVLVSLGKASMADLYEPAMREELAAGYAALQEDSNILP